MFTFIRKITPKNTDIDPSPEVSGAVLVTAIRQEAGAEGAVRGGRLDHLGVEAA